jgi:hypothetical protein
MLVSFLYIYNKCAFFFFKSRYFLTYPVVIIVYCGKVDMCEMKTRAQSFSLSTEEGILIGYAC